MELRIPQRGSRILGWLLLGLFAIPAAMVPIGVLTDGGEFWVILPGMGIFLAAGLITGAQMLYISPHLRLVPEGVEVRIFFRKRFCPWTSFIQAGILSLAVGKEGSGLYVNHLVLLKAGGSKRKLRDLWFPIRNLGRLVYLPDTAEVCRFVKQYYGSLDFNLENGRQEQHFCIEEVPE